MSVNINVNHCTSKSLASIRKFINYLVLTCLNKYSKRKNKFVRAAESGNGNRHCIFTLLITYLYPVMLCRSKLYGCNQHLVSRSTQLLIVAVTLIAMLGCDFKWLDATYCNLVNLMVPTEKKH